jgi:type IV pilus assembly protein PilC
MSAKASQQKLYSWEGKDKRGLKARGEITSVNLALAKARLRKQGINPTKVRKKPKPLKLGFKSKVTAKDTALFARQLATLLQAGVPLIQAFDIISGSTDNAAVKALISQIKTDVAGGNSLADSLGKHPQYFDGLFCGLVAAGEQSGSLENLLDRIATYKEKIEALKAKVKKALTYPTAVVIVALVVTAILLVKVVPQFEGLFQGLGADLPAFTRLVIKLSEFMQNGWLILLTVGIVLSYGLKQAKKRLPVVRDAMEKNSLKIPVIGTILEKSAIARYCRTLATTFAAGVPLVEALESVSGAAGNVVFRQATQRIKEEVTAGQQLQQAMANSGVFPTMALQMVAIGEESGSLDSMLGKVASFYEDEVDNAVDNLSNLLEPLIMLILGILVGGLITAMYLPVFQMGQVV